MTRWQTSVVTVFHCFLTALVVIVSSCSVGGFTCKPGECVSAVLLCDFKTHCENDAHKEFGGICIYLFGRIWKLLFLFKFLAWILPCFIYLFSLVHIWESHLWLVWYQWGVQSLEKGNGKHHLITWCRSHFRKSIRSILTLSCSQLVLKLTWYLFFTLNKCFVF